MGDEEALHEADDDPKRQHEDHDRRPGEPSLERNRGQRVDEREHRADGEVDAAVVITKVMATATIISGAIWRKMLRRFACVRNVSVIEGEDDHHDDEEDGDACDAAAVVDEKSRRERASRGGSAPAVRGASAPRSASLRSADTDWNFRPTIRLTISSMFVSPMRRSATFRPSIEDHDAVADHEQVLQSVCDEDDADASGADVS